MNIQSATAAGEVISLASSSSLLVQVVEAWDASLRNMQPFKEAYYDIFNGKKYKNPALAKK